jgi:hypothetical protein
MATIALATLGTLGTLLLNALQIQSQWGIFDANGNQLGTSSSGGNSLLTTVVESGPILSTNSFEFKRETRVSDFPVEDGGFASYNKVILPGEPTVRYCFSGSVADRTTFLTQLDTACQSTKLYNVKTPEITYLNYNITDYSIIRRADSGANLLIVELHLREIRQVSVSYTTTPSAINQPQNPGATSPSSSGIVQPTNSDTSTLKSLINNFPNFHF